MVAATKIKRPGLIQNFLASQEPLKKRMEQVEKSQTGLLLALQPQIPLTINSQLESPQRSLRKSS